MSSVPVKKIIIVGGGTAGWMAAAALVRFLPKEHYSIQLIESDSIGTIGVGEATVPHIRYFNNMLGIDESEFIQATNATYKLGIRFESWGEIGDSYIHPFGSHGYTINDISFHHYWIKLRQQNRVLPLDQFSMAVIAAEAGSFAYPSDDMSSPLSTYTYAFHIDATAYARYLRQYSEAKGVERLEGKISKVLINQNGDIESVVLESGSSFDGDLFLDCSGFSALLIEKTLKIGYENWGQWLLCDRAVAMPTTSTKKPLLFTRAIAHDFGWQWQIPLQHRVGNGYVYSSQFISDDQAYAKLGHYIDGDALKEPNFLKFTPGRRLESWSKNCVAIGLSSGFLEPLESTSIYLIQIAILKLLEFFPVNKDVSVRRNEFNRQIKNEYEKIRDFIILHYHLNRRQDSDLWKYCAGMALPADLQRKKALFYESAQVEKYKHGLFMEPSWLALYLGQAPAPEFYDRRLDIFDIDSLDMHLKDMTKELKRLADQMSMSRHEIQTILYPKATMSLYGEKK
jgi:tryptophan halogenase